MNCPVCNCEGKGFSKSNRHNSNQNYSRCRSCSSIFSENIATRGELEAYYSNYYTETNLEIPEIVRKSLRRTIQDFEDFRSSINTICDIGFGAGTLLSVAQAEGWKCAGSEYSAAAIKIAERHGWESHQGDLGDSDLLGPFDVLTIIETLEHVQNPRALLQQASSRIRPGGLIYGTTPNGRSLNALILKQHWSIIIFPEHPVLLSKKALKVLLLESGFEQISIQTRGLNPFDLFRQMKVLFKTVKESNSVGSSRVDYGYRLNSTFSSNFGMRVVKHFVMSILALTNLGDSLVFKAVKSAH